MAQRSSPRRWLTTTSWRRVARLARGSTSFRERSVGVVARSLITKEQDRIVLDADRLPGLERAAGRDAWGRGWGGGVKDRCPGGLSADRRQHEVERLLPAVDDHQKVVVKQQPSVCVQVGVIF